MKRSRNFLLLAPLFASFFLLLSGNVPPVFAASSRPTSPSQHTIIWLNAHGQVTRRWTGSSSEAQIIEQREDLKLAQLHARQKSRSLAPSLVTPNISRVSASLCASHTDYLKLWNNESGSAGGVCFANSGDISVNIYDVYKITTGNNEFEFENHQGSTLQSFPTELGHTLCKGLTVYPGASTGQSDGYFDDITYVVISYPTYPCTTTL